MTAVDPATRFEITEVLACHFEDYPNGCGCAGYRPVSRDVIDHSIEHREHLADALAPLIARLRAEAADEALAEVEGDIKRRRDASLSVGDLNDFAIGLASAARIVAARRTGGER